MIYGKISDMPLYFSCNPQLEAAYNFLTEYMNSPKPDGGYEVEQGVLNVNISTYVPSEAETKRFEAHRKYADIQVVLNGTERIDCANIDACTDMLSEEYSKGGDIAFYADPQYYSKVVLEKGMFLFLMPHDAHKPCIAPDESGAKVTKAVFKVLL